MKRSEINQYIDETMQFMDIMNFKLPRWAYWSPDDFQSSKEDVSEITENKLGWDLTDFGSSRFEKEGLILFTIRNGQLNGNGKQYAEKIMVVDENQVTPFHSHLKKTEDIINRGGGNLVIEILPLDKDGKPREIPFTASIDGVKKDFKAGEKVVLQPGDSICLEPGMCHSFYGEAGKGKVLVGEVSSVNDDDTDNVFIQTRKRFPGIEEDVKPQHLLVNDYEKYIA